MSYNTNPQAIAFSNGHIRPLADLLYTTYATCESVVNQWIGQSVASVIPVDSNIIQDGSQSDGRPQITDTQATVLINTAQLFLNLMNGSANTITNDGTKTNLNNVLVVQVNGKAQQ
jgi:hypothetical protein